jgi:hypothetical protein
MSKKNKDINIYIASTEAEEGCNRIGYGFSKARDGEKKVSSKAYRLGSENPTLYLADVLCVAKSLESLKAPASATIYTTSPLIAGAIAEPDTIPDILKKVQKNKPLRKAWEKVEKQLRAHDDVNVVKVDANACEQLTKAQQQATIGTTLPYNKEGAENKKYKRHKKNETLLDISNENTFD